MLINVARLLWTYDIGHSYELCEGRKVKVEVDSMAFTQGFNAIPLPFKAQFTRRSAKTEEIVKREWHAAEKDIDVLLDRIQATHIRGKK
jgi:hypothetical protein